MYFITKCKSLQTICIKELRITILHIMGFFSSLKESDLKESELE